jgi:hypothetical protein
MSFWAPEAKTRQAIKFWLDCLQIITVVGGVIIAVVTFLNYSREQKAQAAEETHRIVERDDRAKEQLKTAKRELERPYQEKKLSLYLDAARVLAHLATSPNLKKEATEARFWELYWGELPFVESRASEEVPGGPPSVERLMVKFCEEYFINESGCTKGKDLNAKIPERSTPLEAAAIYMARRSSEEILRYQRENEGR